MNIKKEIANQKRRDESVSSKVRIEFHDDKAQTVFLGGTFHEWRPEATPMIQLGEGRWRKELMLSPGRYEYRLVVDGEWRTDPAALDQVLNPHGDFNSILKVETAP